MASDRPVAKEKREEIWGEFKDISAEINKRYQAHFEERKAEELRNEQAKTAICERIEALDYTQIKNYAGWDDLTKVIIEAQAEWKTLGFASKKNEQYAVCPLSWHMRQVLCSQGGIFQVYQKRHFPPTWPRRFRCANVRRR